MRPVFHLNWRMCLLFILAVSALAGCANALAGHSLREQITHYELTLRAEADWLWGGMNYAVTHSRLDSSVCMARDFGHHPVSADSNAEPILMDLIDHLDYAAMMIGQARDRWQQFCRGEVLSSPAAFMESRLRPAYDSLNLIRATLLANSTPTPRK